jgi:hypothetical protein
MKDRVVWHSCVSLRPARGLAFSKGIGITLEYGGKVTYYWHGPIRSRWTVA